MGPKRFARGRPRKPKVTDLLSESSLINREPLATSSPPDSSFSHLYGEDLDAHFKEKLDNFFISKRKEFNNFLGKMPREIQDMPFSNFWEPYLQKMINEKENRGNNEKEPEFKLPMGVPKVGKRGRNNSSNAASSSKIVHWSSELNSSTSVKDESESDVFKTPPKRGGSKESKSLNLKTPNTTTKERFAVVTPGPLLNKKVTELRMPQAGETAISLSGSPLYVPTFGMQSTGSGNQAFLGLPGGKVVTIVKPDHSSPDSSDSEMFAHLQDETKEQMKELFIYMLKNMNGQDEKN